LTGGPHSSYTLPKSFAKRLEKMGERSRPIKAEFGPSSPTYRVLLALWEDSSRQRQGSPRLTKRDLERICGLSRPTVDKVIERLEALGLVRRDGYRASSGGRKPVLYRLNAQAGYAIGVDLEIPELGLALCDLAGRPLQVGSFVLPSSILGEPESVLKFVGEKVKGFIGGVGLPRERLLGVGFGVPAFLKGETIVIFGRTLPRWEGVPAKALLERMLGLPVFVDNDVKFMALAESYARGQGQAEPKAGGPADPEVMVYLALRSGAMGDIRMGGSALIGGRIFRGAHGNAVSLQNAFVELDEALGSADSLGLTDRPEEAILKLKERLLPPILNMVMLFDPRYVIINAAVLGEHEALFVRECEEALRGQLGAILDWDLQVQPAREKELACAKGAALFVLQELFSSPEKLIKQLIQGKEVVSEQQNL